ncbi:MULTISPECIES: hypothetical protein [Hwangdonia]|uniref:DUF3955 domain-containing protein n=1 Tax=Hwangdonia seohaensis TaxID=1240727 RepID=A0ABW3R7M8_9FLAO|nr:hypothetical protein [Hwangdonia seohaensis]
MKLLTIILSIAALGLIIFNVTKVDFNAPFQGESIIALIAIVAAICVIIMMGILRISKRIEQKAKKHS